MVFQKPILFQTILRTLLMDKRNGITDKNEIEERVVTTIEQVALWDE
jgi:phosphate transport system ATP-binding protein